MGVISELLRGVPVIGNAAAWFDQHYQEKAGNLPEDIPGLEVLVPQGNLPLRTSFSLYTRGIIPYEIFEQTLIQSDLSHNTRQAMRDAAIRIIAERKTLEDARTRQRAKLASQKAGDALTSEYLDDLEDDIHVLERALGTAGNDLTEVEQEERLGIIDLEIQARESVLRAVEREAFGEAKK